MQGPWGVEELHFLWMTANALTLRRAQPLSLPLKLCENLFYDALFLSFFYHCTVSDYGSPNEHLPGVVIPWPPTLSFISSGYCEINPIISLVTLKAFTLWSCASRDTETSTLSTNPVAPESQSSWILWFRPSLTGGLWKPVSRLINREGLVLLAMRQAVGF